MDAMAQATGMWMAAMPSNEMTSGFKVIQEQAIQFAKQNAEACFALTSESWPMPRTSRMCSPFKAAMHRRRCRPMLFRVKNSAGSW